MLRSTEWKMLCARAEMRPHTCHCSALPWQVFSPVYLYFSDSPSASRLCPGTAYTLHVYSPSPCHCGPHLEEWHSKRRCVKEAHHIANEAKSNTRRVVVLTFDGVQEIFHSVLVQAQGLLIILCLVFLCGFCHKINCFLQWRQRHAVRGLMLVRGGSRVRMIVILTSGC